MEVIIDAELFSTRLKKLHTSFISNKEAWNGADVLCVPMGASSDEELNYSKSSALHLYLLGYEFSDSILILTKNTVCFMATAKKCGLIETAIQTKAVEGLKFEFFKKTKDEGSNREAFNAMLAIIRKNGCTKIGTLLKGSFPGIFIPAWTEAVAHSTIPTGEIGSALGAAFAVKDSDELVSVYFIYLYFNFIDFVFFEF